jgi:hypothetical protein
MQRKILNVIQQYHVKIEGEGSEELVRRRGVGGISKERKGGGIGKGRKGWEELVRKGRCGRN